MADGNFRNYRRDQVAPRSADLAARANSDDPLAELARLIGQGEPSHDGYDRRRDSHDGYAGPAGGVDWASDDRDAEPSAESYAEPDDAYDPQTSEAHEYEPPRLEPIAAPEPRFVPRRESPRSMAVAPARYQQPELPEPRDQLPAFLPQRDVRYEYDDPAPSAPEDHAYEAEDYGEEDAPRTRRRGGLVVIAAVLGLAVLGTAGAFAYRAMFGASMLPSLPPIIKADDTPNKIVPPSKQNASAQSDTNGRGSGERLVSREEQPVNIAPAANPAPRVVSTIPIFPDSNTGAPNMVASGGANFPASAAQTPVSVAPGQAVFPPPPGNAAAPNAPAALPGVATAIQAPVTAPEPKKVHTVAIHPDQLGNLAEASVAAPPPPAAMPTALAPVAPAPAPQTRMQPPMRTAAPVAPRLAPAAPAGPNAPLSIVPDQAGPAPAASAARPRPAPAQPMALATAERPPAAAPGGAYSVQVTSQKTEAEAQAEYRAMRAKFPNVLGNHEPMVRRADLGAKGVYYRALVGPFGSMEQAAAMCSELKAAGGNCIVQRN